MEVCSFYPPKLPLGGVTNLGAALGALMAEIDKNVLRTAADHKGDWTPIFYLFTDGSPPLDPSAPFAQRNAQYAG